MPGAMRQESTEIFFVMGKNFSFTRKKFSTSVAQGNVIALSVTRLCFKMVKMKILLCRVLS